MFEKEAEEWAIDYVCKDCSRYKECKSKEHCTCKECSKEKWQNGAEFGYNKCKEELNQKGVALQSDMNKTIEQNIALKKELNKACLQELQPVYYALSVTLNCKTSTKITWRSASRVRKLFDINI